MEPLMAARGVPWLIRKLIAAKGTPPVTLVQTADTLSSTQPLPTGGAMAFTCPIFPVGSTEASQVSVVDGAHSCGLSDEHNF